MTSTPALPGVIIIGAGHAGGSAALALREAGHAGPIHLLGNEAHLPYQRPPLSKAVLKGEAGIEALWLRQEHVYAEQRIQLHHSTLVTRIDREARLVHHDAGSPLPYEWVILATGATPRPLPGASSRDNLFQLRTLDDAEGLRQQLQPGRRLLILGGGYIGLEVAAVARSLGVRVTVLEREPRLLARVASAPMAEWLTEHHRQQGVEILTGVQVAELCGNPRVESVRLGDGRHLPCDLVLVGIGATPCDQLAREAGLDCDQGVLVNHRTETSDPRILAIGDACRRPLHHYGNTLLRLESVPSALEMARIAAHVITAQPLPQVELPWFWSDQYGLKLQIAGLPLGADRQLVRYPDDPQRRAVYHLQGDRLVCVEALNSPLDFMAGRKLIPAGARLDPEQLVRSDTRPMDAVRKD